MLFNTVGDCMVHSPRYYLLRLLLQAYSTRVTNRTPVFHAHLSFVLTSQQSVHRMLQPRRCNPNITSRPECFIHSFSFKMYRICYNTLIATLNSRWATSGDISQFVETLENDYRVEVPSPWIHDAQIIPKNQFKSRVSRVSYEAPITRQIIGKK